MSGGTGISTICRASPPPWIWGFGAMASQTPIFRAPSPTTTALYIAKLEACLPDIYCIATASCKRPMPIRACVYGKFRCVSDYGDSEPDVPVQRRLLPIVSRESRFCQVNCYDIPVV